MHIVRSQPQSNRRAPSAVDRRVEHAAVYAAAGEIGIDVRDVGHGGECVRVVPAAADMREYERAPRMPHGEPREVGAIRDLL